MKSFIKEQLTQIRDTGATQLEKDLAENLLSMWDTLLKAIDSSEIVKDALFDALHMLGGWPPVIGTLMGAIICLSADTYYERKNARSADEKL